MSAARSAPAAAGRPTLPACAICGGPTLPAGRRLIACQACGTGMTFPAPDAAELDAAYAGAYRPAGGRFGAGGDRLLAATRGSLARRVDALAPPGPVLDVGSGDGSLLRALTARGREAVGLERDIDARVGPPPAGRSLADTQVRAVDLTAFTERTGAWAAIVLWHSLEHLPDPLAALDRAAALLTPGGLLIVAVPNYASWQARLFGDRWLALDLPRHLIHLTPAGLTAALADRGLAVQRISFWRGGQVLFGWLHGLVSALPGHLDLYDAIRRPAARAAPLTPAARAAALLAAIELAPLGTALAAAEILARRGGSVFLQARAPLP